MPTSSFFWHVCVQPKPDWQCMHESVFVATTYFQIFFSMHSNAPFAFWSIIACEIRYTEQRARTQQGDRVSLQALGVSRMKALEVGTRLLLLFFPLLHKHVDDFASRFGCIAMQAHSLPAAMKISTRRWMVCWTTFLWRRRGGARASFAKTVANCWNKAQAKIISQQCYLSTARHN